MIKNDPSLSSSPSFQFKFNKTKHAFVPPLFRSLRHHHLHARLCYSMVPTPYGGSSHLDCVSRSCELYRCCRVRSYRPECPSYTGSSSARYILSPTGSYEYDPRRIEYSFTWDVLWVLDWNVGRQPSPWVFLIISEPNVVLISCPHPVGKNS